MTMDAAQSACLVLHGKAARREDVRAAVRAVRDDGFHVDVHVTWEGGDAARFARRAANEGFGVVIAGGGDGTVNEVVSGLLDRGNNETGPSPAWPFCRSAPPTTWRVLAACLSIPLEPYASRFRGPRPWSMSASATEGAS